MEENDISNNSEINGENIRTLNQKILEEKSSPRKAKLAPLQRFDFVNNQSNQTHSDPRLEQLQNELNNLEKLLLITKNKFFSQQQKYNQVVNEMNQARNSLILWYRRFMSNRSNYNYRHLMYYWNQFQQAQSNVNKERQKLNEMKQALENIERANKNAKKTYGW